jgi:hypothetical protein
MEIVDMINMKLEGVKFESIAGRIVCGAKIEIKLQEKSDGYIISIFREKKLFKKYGFEERKKAVDKFHQLQLQKFGHIFNRLSDVS